MQLSDRDGTQHLLGFWKLCKVLFKVENWYFLIRVRVKAQVHHIVVHQLQESILRLLRCNRAVH